MKELFGGKGPSENHWVCPNSLSFIRCVLGSQLAFIFTSITMWGLCPWQFGSSVPLPQASAARIQQKSSLVLYRVEFGVSPTAKIKAQIFSFQLCFESVSYTRPQKLLCGLGFSSSGCSHQLSLHSTFGNIHWDIFSPWDAGASQFCQNTSKSSQTVTVLLLMPNVLIPNAKVTFDLG